MLQALRLLSRNALIRRVPEPLCLHSGIIKSKAEKMGLIQRVHIFISCFLDRDENQHLRFNSEMTTKTKSMTSCVNRIRHSGFSFAW